MIVYSLSRELCMNVVFYFFCLLVFEWFPFYFHRLIIMNIRQWAVIIVFKESFALRNIYIVWLAIILVDKLLLFFFFLLSPRVYNGIVTQPKMAFRIIHKIYSNWNFVQTHLHEVEYYMAFLFETSWANTKGVACVSITYCNLLVFEVWLYLRFLFINLMKLSMKKVNGSGLTRLNRILSYNRVETQTFFFCDL